jgi:flagellar biosynthesis/type III secretory pathway protein FliH
MESCKSSSPIDCIEWFADRIAELEKENAELKAENQKWKDEWQEQVQKATDEGYARTLQTMQLTKAKEIIKELLSSCFGYNSKTVNYEIKAEAEQFLSEVEK